MSLANNNSAQFVCPAPAGGAQGAAVRENLPEQPAWEFDDEFDGGEETCGRVIVNLHLYIRDQPPGLRVLVISRDPGAPVELPAWCRMTKNELTAMQHPYYLITLKPHLRGS